jgi:hypothetical protein
MGRRKASSTSHSERRYVSLFLAMAITVTTLVAGATEAMIRVMVEPADPMMRYLALFRTADGGKVVFGDSVVMSGFTGQPGWINLALGGDDMDAMLAKMRLYFSTRQPDRVIIEAAPHHFAAKYRNRSQRGDFAAMLTDDPWWWPRIAGHRHRGAVWGYWSGLLRTGRPLDGVRFEPDGARLNWNRFSHLDPATRAVSGANTAAELRPLEGFASWPALGELKDVIGQLRRRGAEICLVVFPVSPQMAAAARQWPSYATARKAFEALAADADAGARYVDLFDADLSDEMFADGNHINGFGAPMVAEMVTSRCFGSAPP